MSTDTGTIAVTEAKDVLASSGTTTVSGTCAVTEQNDTLLSLYKGPIIAEIIDPTHLSINSYNDGTISFPTYKTTTLPAISDACRYILKTVGLVSGSFAARPYKMQIRAGSNVVFIVPSIYYGSRNTQLPDLSDIEVTRGITFTGQFI